MVTFTHRSGRTETAEPGTKRFAIFNRSSLWRMDEDNGLTALTKAELLTAAAEQGVEVDDKMTKAEIVKALEG